MDSKYEIDAILTDPRFANIHEDPRFRNIPTSQRKVKLDERFEAVLKNELFSEKASMDPRGRPRNFGCKENYNKFYEMGAANDDYSKNENICKEKSVIIKRKKSKKISCEKFDSNVNNDESCSETNMLSKEKFLSVSNVQKMPGNAINCKSDQIMKQDTDNFGVLSKPKSLKKSKIKSKKVIKNYDNSADISESKEVDGDSAKVPANKNAISLKKLEPSAIPEDLLERLLDMNHDVTRGGNMFSDDSSDDDSSTTDEEDGDAFGEFEWGELDCDAKWDRDENIEETSRFAVCNMDFDQVKAVDLLVLFSSFAPVVGRVKKVATYLSEFGKQRLAEEDEIGPPELAKLGSTSNGVDADLQYLDKVTKGTLDETTRPSAKYIEALRRYQRNRLKYYYAVVECDSANTAKVIYKECDRMPYEVGGITLDLRYIPDDMDFDNEVVKDCCETLPSNYVSEVFQTTCLFDSNPTLTWDETDRSRRNTITSAMSKALKKQSYDFKKLQSYIGGSSSEEEDEGNESSEGDKESSVVSKDDRIAKFRALIDELEEKENKKSELEIDKEETFEVREDDDEGIKNNDDNNGAANGLTPFEKFLVKRKEKRKDKSKKMEEKEEVIFSDDELPEDAKNISSDPFFASEKIGKNKSKRNKKKGVVKQTESLDETDGELNLMLMDEEEEDLRHFNMRKIIEADSEKIKKKGKNKNKNLSNEDNSAVDFKIDLSDPRFAAVTKSRDFNIDPSHPQYVSTKAMSVLTRYVPERVKEDISIKQIHSKRSRLQDDVSHLVKKVKLKAKEKNIF